MMEDIEKKFVESLKQGYIKYLTVHPRSTEKIMPMHKCIAEIIKERLGDEYHIKSKGIGDGKEFKFEGKYYEKELDITILKNKDPVSAIAFKFVTSNYKQNSNNYFENMLGETANIRRNDLLYGQILILKEKMPYFSTDKKRYTKIEKINEKNLKKYLKLGKDSVEYLYHKPDLMFIAFIRTGDEQRLLEAIENEEYVSDKKAFNMDYLLPLVEQNGVKIVNPDELEEDFSPEMIDFLKKHSNFKEFIEAFINLTKGKTYGR